MPARLALLGVLAITTGTTTGVAVAGVLALVVLTREVGRLRLHTARVSDVDAVHPALTLVAAPGVPGDAAR